MGLARALWILLIVVLPTVAKAVDLNLSMSTTTLYDNNIFRTDGGEDGDVSFRFAPTIRLHDEDRKLAWSLRYRPAYEKFVKYDELDKLSHFANGTLDYQLGDKTRLSLSEAFTLTQSGGRARGTEDDDIAVVPDNETRRADIYRNRVSLALAHSFAPRVAGQLVLSHDFFDSNRETSARNTNLGALASLSYALDARNRVGGGAGASWQDYESTPRQPGSDTFVYRIFGTWVRLFGDTTELTLRAGPALITTERQSSGNATTGQSSDERITFFGEASLLHRWTPHLSSSLTYSRSDSGATSLGASTIADRVSLHTAWRPARRWDLSLRGDWVSRSSANGASEIGTTGKIETEYWSASGRAAYRIMRRSTLIFRLTYQNQETKRPGSTGINTTFANVLAFVGFRYDFDPLHF